MEGHENHNPEDVIQLFAFLSKKYNLAILYEAFHHESVRFGQLEVGIKGISTRTLSLRLTELEENGFLKRNISREKPVVISYSLTEKAKDLGDVFMELAKWSMKWSSGKQKKNTKK